MNLYDIAIARKLSGGGGGGSSDFSTANVTFICANPPKAWYLMYCFCDDENNAIQLGNFKIENSTTLKIPLYKGKAILTWLSISESSIEGLAVSGDVELDYVNNQVIITGDGSLTLGGAYPHT